MFDNKMTASLVSADLAVEAKKLRKRCITIFVRAIFVLLTCYLNLSQWQISFE